MATIGEGGRRNGFPSGLARIATATAVAVLCFSAGFGQALAGQVSLIWDANTEPNLSGYRISYGTAAGTYTTTIDVGNVTTSTVAGLADGQVFFFAVKAYNTTGNESGYSNEVSYSTPGPQEINVVGNSVSIVDGDATPAVGDHSDFGGAEIAGGTVTRTFTIQNLGSGTLALSGSPLVAVSGAQATDFTVITLPATAVTAAGSTSFQVTFDPSATGTRSASLSIANNDANENPYDFSIQGVGTASPDVNLVGNSVSILDGDTTPTTADHTDFDGTRLDGGTVTRTFTIQNLGSATLTLSGSPLVAVSGVNAGEFTVTALPAAAVAAAGSTTFQVTFDPGAAGIRSATLSIVCNDLDENTYDFAIQGRGAAPPSPPRNIRASP